MDRAQELDIKHERLAKLLSKLKVNGVLLRTRANFAWITGGGRSGVNESVEAGVAGVLVTADALRIVTNNIEAERLFQEELHDDVRDRFTVIGCDWWRPESANELLLKIVGKGKVAVDTGLGGPNIAAGIAAVRGSLTEAEVRRYMTDGPALAATLEVVAQQVRRGITEREVEAMIRRVLGEVGFRVAVCLVGADERIDRRRHPVPTDQEVDRRAMLVAVAERSGLYCAATRIVALGEPDGELRRKMRAVAEVHATAIAAIEPGRRWAQVLEAIVQAYADAGYAEEWKLHHQGGPIGYQPRDQIVTPGTRGEIAEAQAVAWNPTITGVKCEDTVITGTGGRLMLCGPGEGWPAFEIERDGRPIRCADMLVAG